MSTITLFGPRESSYVRTARMTCIEKGLEHELRPIELGSETHRGLHPWCKVPILEHEGTRIFETIAICRYLDDAFEGPSLTPRGAKERATMEQWISALNCYLYDDLIRDYALQYIFPRGADGKPNRAVIDPAVSAMNRDLDAIERGLGNRPYLAGDALSLADLFYAPALFTISFFPEGKQALSARPNVKALLDRLSERTSFRKVNA